MTAALFYAVYCSLTQSYEVLWFELVFGLGVQCVFYQ